MNIAGYSSVVLQQVNATSTQSADLQSTVSVSLLKKTMDMQTRTASQLIASVSESLGSQVDTYA